MPKALLSSPRSHSLFWSRSRSSPPTRPLARTEPRGLAGFFLGLHALAALVASVPTLAFGLLRHHFLRYRLRWWDIFPRCLRDAARHQKRRGVRQRSLARIPFARPAA